MYSVVYFKISIMCNMIIVINVYTLKVNVTNSINKIISHVL